MRGIVRFGGCWIVLSGKAGACGLDKVLSGNGDSEVLVTWQRHTGERGAQTDLRGDGSPIPTPVSGSISCRSRSTGVTVQYFVSWQRKGSTW